MVLVLGNVSFDVIEEIDLYKISVEDRQVKGNVKVQQSNTNVTKLLSNVVVVNGFTGKDLNNLEKVFIINGTIEVAMNPNIMGIHSILKLLLSDLKDRTFKVVI